MEKVVETLTNTSLEKHVENLQRGQTGKSTECVFINVSDVVEG